MIICKVEWVPENKDPRFQFRITRCGVVRISEMAARAETVLNSERDETQAYIKTAVDALEVGNPWEYVQMVPILHMLHDEAGNNSSLRTSGVTLKGLRYIPYNAEWRKTINQSGDDAPGALGAHDHEHDF
ncbi:hypothetical protein GLOTRDRAFT_141508 [Gloeophyllum trabeum ATCC 11539]|uniref:Uncharacterized protein n=1 Tax=Gloeophyllum trabeum (strain ATCC 11539 / FP-39264 / Madison 617) TaxID=670483 RepID=S7PSJ8_GLOTA|nr:uncharacterized protein GLOTRDRAFT_141508 [Gloeophyllum trabeum ATCC 11539]EPQ50393.1 hypothetical protein GLOTRDRAFT_141508 [Gloeophyllum trabeum ATCC 11539]